MEFSLDLSKSMTTAVGALKVCPWTWNHIANYMMHKKEKDYLLCELSLHGLTSEETCILCMLTWLQHFVIRCEASPLSSSPALLELHTFSLTPVNEYPEFNCRFCVTRYCCGRRMRRSHFMMDRWERHTNETQTKVMQNSKSRIFCGKMI